MSLSLFLVSLPLYLLTFPPLLTFHLVPLPFALAHVLLTFCALLMTLYSCPYLCADTNVSCPFPRVLDPMMFSLYPCSSSLEKGVFLKTQ